MPIELGDSWFSPKCIEVQPQTLSFGGRALDGLGGLSLTKPNQTTNAKRFRLGVSPWGINFTDKRETTQTTG
jgi:hypothetical protein